MNKRLKFEGIPYPGARIYSFIAIKSPPLRDLCKEAAEEITATMASGRVLDVGTGPGYLPLEIAKRAPSLDITGIDLSPAMVKIAGTNAKRRGYSDRVRFLHANASNIPFEEGDFDLVVSTLSFHHWARPLECLKELHRVLKEKGEAWIYDARRDTTREVNLQFRSRYGWFLAFLFLNLVRAHSSVTMREIEAALSSSPRLGFSRRIVVDKGVFIKLKLAK
jgi:ubiquinone/menaquinone biosynthesis C-methylase UbiE